MMPPQSRYTKQSSQISRLCLLLMVLIFPLSAQARDFSDGKYHLQQRPVPEWVVGVSVTPEAKSDLGKVRYILTDTQIHQAKDGTISHYTHFISQPLTSAGLESESQVEVTFNSAYQTLDIHDITIRRDGQRADRFENARIQFNQKEHEAEYLMYTGEVTATIFLSDVRVGDEVECSYTLHGDNPIFAGRFFTEKQLGWASPVDRSFFRISVPADKSLFFTSVGKAVAIEQGEDGPFHFYQYDESNVKGEIFENDSPDWYFPYPWLSFSDFPSWQDVAIWGYGLFTASMQEPGEEMQKLINDLSKNSETQEEYIVNALKFVQNDIRYLSLSMGENSHLPHPPNEVLHNRYGDCKDKTLLFITLLHAKNIAAQPALVSYAFRQTVDEGIASPAPFDHVISRVVFDGKVFWLDPTRTQQEGKLIFRPVSRFSKALVLSPDSPGFETMPSDIGMYNRAEITEHFETKDLDSPVSLHITSHFHGVSAEQFRSTFSNETIAEIGNDFVDYYANYYENITLVDLQFKDHTADNSFTMEEWYTLTDFWQPTKKGKYLTADFYHTPVQDRVIAPNLSTRKTPYALNTPILLHHTLLLDLPADIDLDIANSTIEKKTSNLSYKSKTTTHRGRYRMDSDFASTTDYVPAQDIKAYRKFIDAVDKDSYYSITIPATGGASNLRRSFDVLKDFLKDH